MRASGATTVRCKASVRDGHAASSDPEGDTGNAKEHTCTSDTLHAKTGNFVRNYKLGRVLTGRHVFVTG